ncbi:uncharacterized protein LOC119662607 [Teleopsis dalmanni]|uniref:uncharacterized protein LOC119662590 n=1 Tax=Teleopsis dalmanni TaxID=139649 RepID=UPI0018CD8D3A|nr:uncharacterized protein LOC119662590 [Teleopsis dalmanni]XP_037928189.1 uncharacterized protein LOC119662607 [Teleopsis dalmanni]
MLICRKNLVTFKILLLLLLSICAKLSESLIVPQELPSILSLVYSNIPPIKKGTDSRLGFGFRLGEHADFQILVELGPQKETRPIGEKDGSESSFNKRHVSKSDQRNALRQYYRQQQRQQELTSTERSAANWLENWSKDMNANSKKSTKEKRQQIISAKQQFPKVAGLPAVPVVPENSLKQLQMLYKMAGTTATMTMTVETTTTQATTTQQTSTTPVPFRGGPLNLGGPAGFTLSPLLPIKSQNPLRHIPTLLDPRTNTLKESQQEKSKEQITKELMDVSLEAEE